MLKITVVVLGPLLFMDGSFNMESSSCDSVIAIGSGAAVADSDNLFGCLDSVGDLPSSTFTPFS